MKSGEEQAMAEAERMDTPPGYLGRHLTFRVPLHLLAPRCTVSSLLLSVSRQLASLRRVRSLASEPSRRPVST
jgi:hypothetical protein